MQLHFIDHTDLKRLHVNQQDCEVNVNKLKYSNRTVSNCFIEVFSQPSHLDILIDLNGHMSKSDYTIGSH